MVSFRRNCFGGLVTFLSENTNIRRVVTNFPHLDQLLTCSSHSSDPSPFGAPVKAVPSNPALTTCSGRADRLRPRNTLPIHCRRCSVLNRAVSSRKPEPERSHVHADQALPSLHPKVRDALKATFLHSERTDLDSLWTAELKTSRLPPSYGLPDSLLSALTH